MSCRSSDVSEHQWTGRYLKIPLHSFSICIHYSVHWHVFLCLTSVSSFNYSSLTFMKFSANSKYKWNAITINQTSLMALHGLFFFKRQKYTRHWWHCVTAWQNAQWETSHSTSEKEPWGWESWRRKVGWKQVDCGYITSSAALLQGLLLCLLQPVPLVSLGTAAHKHKIKSGNKGKQNSTYSALFKGLKKP